MLIGCDWSPAYLYQADRTGLMFRLPEARHRRGPRTTSDDYQLHRAVQHPAYEPKYYLPAGVRAERIGPPTCSGSSGRRPEARCRSLVGARGRSPTSPTLVAAATKPSATITAVPSAWAYAAGPVPDERGEEHRPDDGLADREPDPLGRLQHPAGRAPDDRVDVRERERLVGRDHARRCRAPSRTAARPAASTACSVGVGARHQGHRDRAGAEGQRARRRPADGRAGSRTGRPAGRRPRCRPRTRSRRGRSAARCSPARAGSRAPAPAAARPARGSRAAPARPPRCTTAAGTAAGRPAGPAARG